MENETLSKVAKVAAILHAINKNQKLKNPHAAASKFFKYQTYEIDGQIGADVTFFKDYSKYVIPAAENPALNIVNESTRVDVACQAQNLGHIAVKREINGNQINENIAVIAPSCKNRHVVVTKEQTVATEKNKAKNVALEVYHDVNETADAVLDRINAAITKSYDKAVVAKKLRKLNLPSQVTIKDHDALVSDIVDQIHQADDRTM
ncbi:MAG: hypothetical protein NC133_04260 [Prevotella sp.]|nr:hypothetical protein [Prevotella sp.]